MVQRKAPTKLGHGHSHSLGLKADHVKTENLSQHLELKSNIGTDLKKKMKKSGSIKRPKQPVKPVSPPLQRQSPVTPNYMKSTTSSDARKEQSQSQVSTRNHSTSPSSSSLRRKSSDSAKISSSSGKKLATKTLARSLTKNPSFKPARANARKCAPVVLCEDLDVQKATCSSTLKDCKFPTYLSLNRGGTESEGTSTIKVCPYTYCSLNGHHRAPVPPLKCFLSARRRMIKTQRSVKLGCLSPRRVKPVGDDRLSEENKGFFVEIYCKKDEDGADNAGVDGSDETATEDQEERGVETLLDAPVSDDYDTCEVLDQNREVESINTGNICHSEQNQEVKVDEEEEINPGFVTESLVETTPNVHFYELNSEASDMEWETGYLTPLYLDYDHECSPGTETEPDPEASTGENCNTNDEFIIKSDSKEWCLNELLVDEVSQESFDEQSLNSDAFSSSDDNESTGSYDNMQSLSMETSAPVEVLEEEAEPARDNLNHEHVTNEDATTEMVNQVSNVEKSDGDENISTSSNIDSGKEPHSEVAPLKSTEDECRICRKVKAENAATQEMEDSALALVIAKSKKPIQDDDELGNFNPRAPNFLPLKPDPEAEKVDLRHQDVDERRNSDEWMVDYALRQVVTKLAPARKRKVALLVEAFEKVMPASKFDLHLMHSPTLDQARPIQACS